MSLQEQSPCEEGLLAVPFEVPKELWLLVDHLHKYGLTQVSLGKKLCKFSTSAAKLFNIINININGM